MRNFGERFLRQLMRVPGVHGLWVKFPLGSMATRVRYDVWRRPEYAFGVYSAADLGRRLGLKGISVFEFGVAGGRGLLALEHVAAAMSAYFAIEIAVFGFDSGSGMPAPVDYRDLPHVWGEGFYEMHRDLLESKLKRAKLVIGDVRETVLSFVPPYPVGFIAFDLDYYSSTKASFRLFESDHLPRTYCYFDDTIWPQIACHNEYIGELCAIREFNNEHKNHKLCQIHGLHYMRDLEAIWHEKMYVLHDFQHPLYTKRLTPTGEQYTQLHL